MLNKNNITLIKCAQAGDKDAKSRIVEENTNLVHSIIQDIPFSLKYIEYEDLLQEGLLALSQCVDTFNVDMGVKFSTYAYKVIHFSLINYINENSSSFHVPKSAVQTRAAITKLLAEKEANGEPVPSVKDIAETLSVPTDSVVSFLECNCVNLSDTVYEDCKYADVIPDSSPTPDTLCEKQALSEHLAKTMDKKLNTDEKYILTSYFGFDGKPKNMPSLAKELGITTQAISSKYHSALRKLKVALVPYVSI